MPNNERGSNKESVRKRKRQYMQQRRQDPEFRAAEAARKRGVPQAADGWHRKQLIADAQLAQMAKVVYGEYQRLMGWPQVPPSGLRVAVNPERVGIKGREAAVVSLNELQPAAGPSGASVPPLVADHSLDLEDVGVRSRIFAAEVEWPDYQAAVQAKGNLLHMLQPEEFGPEAAPPAPSAGQAQNADPVRYADQAQPEPETELFGGVDLDALAAHAVDSNTWDWQSVGLWPASVNPVAPSALAHLPGVEGQAPDYYGTAALSQGMDQLSLATPHLPAPDVYNPVGQLPQVAYAQWDSTPFQQPSNQPYPRPYTQPAPQTGAYPPGRADQPGQPTGRKGGGRSGRPAHR
ncbi:hypothetical protein [Streptomyces axinellae]